MGWLAGYAYRRLLTIDKDKISSDLASGFPVLVSFSGWTNITDGDDVKFTDSDETTKLNYEKEYYSAGAGVFHVQIDDVVSSSANTIFYMYYGKTGDSDESTSSTWDSDYVAVYHLSASAVDSTANGLDLTLVNSPTEVTGKIHKALDFNGTDEYAYHADDADFDITSAITLEVWAYHDALITPAASIISKWNYAGNKRSYDIAEQSEWIYPHISDNGLWSDTAGSYIIVDCLTASVWQYLVHTYDNGVNNNCRFQRNTTKYTSSDPMYTGASSIYSGTAPFQIAASDNDGTPARYFDGILDEVRASKIQRSAAWLDATYYSGMDTLLSKGDEESQGFLHSQGIMI